MVIFILQLLLIVSFFQFFNNVFDLIKTIKLSYIQFLFEQPATTVTKIVYEEKRKSGHTFFACQFSVLLVSYSPVVNDIKNLQR